MRYATLDPSLPTKFRCTFLELILEDASLNNYKSPIIESATLIEQRVALNQATASSAQFLKNRVIARLAKLISQSYPLIPAKSVCLPYDLPSLQFSEPVSHPKNSHEIMHSQVS